VIPEDIRQLLDRLDKDVPQDLQPQLPGAPQGQGTESPTQLLDYLLTP
jgi:hypothetical protein